MLGSVEAERSSSPGASGAIAWIKLKASEPPTPIVVTVISVSKGTGPCLAPAREATNRQTDATTRSKRQLMEKTKPIMTSRRRVCLPVLYAVYAPQARAEKKVLGPNQLG